MTKLPSKNDYFDALIYSLSIMPTDQYQVLKEAYRVLKEAGKLLIIEVKSRVKTVKEFASKIEKFGFQLDNCQENEYFFSCMFTKKA